MANTELIRAYIRDSGYKMQFVAQALQLSSNALCQKLQGRTQFKLDEAERLSAVLGLSMAERDACFFDQQNRRDILARRAEEARRAAYDDRAEGKNKAGAAAVRPAAAGAQPGGPQLVQGH